MKLPELEIFFKTANYPDEIRIDECSIITNVEKMVTNHIKFLKANSGNRKYQPYYDRLILVYRTLNQGQ